jgi:hypothetical protein
MIFLKGSFLSQEEALQFLLKTGKTSFLACDVEIDSGIRFIS